MWAALAIAGMVLPLAGATPRITEAQKIAIIRGLIAEVGIARHALPPDKKGVDVDASGQMLHPAAVADELDRSGVAAKIGDRVAITAIEFKGDQIAFAVNGGPHKEHWYSHVSISMSGNAQPVGTTNQVGARGALITVHFAHAVPPLTLDEVKHDLAGLIDWDPPSKAEEMVKALPAPVKAAIDAHHVLVGMDTSMVVAAMGRTENKTRETDAEGKEYEDWVYGEPPAATVFVRFMGERVVRVTTYRVDGTQTVDDTPDPSLQAAVQQQQQQAAAQAQEAAQPPPTLRRPGDPAPPADPGTRTKATPVPMPGTTPPGGAPPVVCCRQL